MLDKVVGVIIACIGLAVMTVGLLAYTAVVRVAVVMSYWSWFLVPLGAPVITWPHALGLAGLLTYLTTNSTPQKNEMPLGKWFLQTFLKVTGTGLIVWSFGYLYQWWM